MMKSNALTNKKHWNIIRTRIETMWTRRRDSRRLAKPTKCYRILSNALRTIVPARTISETSSTLIPVFGGRIRRSAIASIPLPARPPRQTHRRTISFVRKIRPPSTICTSPWKKWAKVQWENWKLHANDSKWNWTRQLAMRKCWKSKSSLAGRKVKGMIISSFLDLAFQGTKITFEGEGDAADQHTIPGDIVFIIRDRPHPIFERSNSDLIYRVKLTLKQALLGTLLVIPFLNASRAPFQLRTYREVLMPQTEKRFPNEGLPHPKEPTRHGDLIVKFDILFPKVLSAEQRSLIDSCFSNSMEFYQAHNSPLHTTVIDPAQPAPAAPPPPSHPNQKSSHRHANGSAGLKSPASPSQTINQAKEAPPVAPTADLRGTVFWNGFLLQSDFSSVMMGIKRERERGERQKKKSFGTSSFFHQRTIDEIRLKINDLLRKNQLNRRRRKKRARSLPW